MIEVDNYVPAEDVMLFRKLAIMSDDDFKHTFKKCPLHLCTTICTIPSLHNY